MCTRITLCHPTIGPLSESDFTVKVDNLPADATDREELRSFFEGFAGSVSDVVIAFNDGALLELYNQRNAMKTRADAAERRGEAEESDRIQQEIFKHDDVIKEAREGIRLEPVCAYVTFEWKSTATSVLKKYPARWWQRWCCANEMYKFRGATVFKLSRAPLAASVLYPNLAVGSIMRFLRRLVTVLICVVCIGLTAGATWFSQSYQTKLVQANRDCPVGVTTAMADASATLMQCFCAQTPSDTGRCPTAASDAFMAMITLYGCGLVATIANTIIGVAVQKVGPFEKHMTMQNEQSSMIVKMVIAMVINTALVPMIIRGDFSAFGGSIGLNGTFTEFSADWYNVVGEQIYTSMFFNMFVPHFVACLALPCGRCKRACRRPFQSTQADLNAVYAGYEFHVASRYAAALNTIFVAFIFYSGLPALLLFAGASLFIAFWSERFSLFYESRMPAKLDRSVSDAATSLLPVAAFLHCLFGGWMMTSPALASPTTLGAFVTSLGSGVSTGYSSALSLFDNAQVGSVAFVTRALNWNALAQLLIAVLMIVYYVLKWLRGVFDCYEFTCCDGCCAGACVGVCRSARVRPDEVSKDWTFVEAQKRFPIGTYRVSGACAVCAPPVVGHAVIQS